MLFSKTVTSSNGEALVPPRNFLSDLQDPARLLASPDRPRNPLAGTFAPAMPNSPARLALSARRVPALVANAFVVAALALWAAPQGAQAAGLGRLAVHSSLGQPLDAEVEVPAVGRDEAPSLQVRLASQAAFKQANLEFNPSLTQLRFDLQTRADGTFIVHITSAQAISEPYLDLLLELTWSSGRVLREYTVLLDPPGLRQSPEIVAPAASPPPAVATPAPVSPPVAAVPTEPVPAMPAPAAPAAPPPPPPVAQQRAVPLQPAAPAPETPASIHVKPGDTLGKIALETKGAGVSLDQMLVALLQANPAAFVGGNMNRLLAGKDVVVPGTDAAAGIDPSEAHKEVAAQSADFAAYRSRLGQLAAAAPPVPEKQPTAAAQGKVTAKVEDKGAAPKSGDQLKIAKADANAAAAAAAAAKKDEEIARQRAIKEEKDRAAALKKANDDLKRAMDLEARNAAEKKKADDEKAAREKVLADKVAAAKAVADKAAADKASADKAAADKLALKSAAAAAAAQQSAAKAEPPKAEPPKVEPSKPVVPPVAAPASTETGGGIGDLLQSPVVLAGAGGVLLLALVALNFMRRKRGGKSDQFKTENDPMAANSLFGAAGGQSVDTGATSTFNSSFIPAASQLDSNEVDPVAEADVYVAYGREEQAEDILKEALRLQPDRHAVRVKLLEIYSRRGDVASFNAVAKELHDRTGAVGDDWDRAARLGKTLDPTNPLYAGAPSAPEPAPQSAPATELRLDAGSKPARGLAANTTTNTGAGGATTRGGEFDIDTISAMVGDQKKLLGKELDMSLPDTALAPETLMPVESSAPAVAPSTGLQRFEAKLPPEPMPFAKSPPMPVPAPVAPAPAAAAASARAPAIDFGSLDFDLGPSKLNIDAQTELPVESADTEAPMPATVSIVEPPTIPSLDLMFPPTTPGGPRPPATVSGSVPIPSLDLNLPSSSPARTTLPVATSTAGSLEEALSRPTLVGGIGGLTDGDMPRLSSNTDQATVPLIDFDLTGADAALTGRRTETQAGSPMASQMATKLDLARGYIDLGVKDGARELLEEVMKDGTREQRQQAVELIKLVEA
jgi:pilus assembly protein FimV